MEEIDELLADETFCRSLLNDNVMGSATLTDIKVESNEFHLWSSAETEGPLQVDGDFFGTIENVIESGNAARLSPSESGRSSIAESASGSSLAQYGSMVQFQGDQTSAYSYAMNEFDMPSSGKASSGESSSNSNSDPLEDQFEAPYDEELELDFNDSDADEDLDDSNTQSGAKSRAAGKNGGSTQPTMKKPPLFQPLRSTGELKLTELEKQTLAQEGLSIQTRLPLSKHDERILKQIRRKIRNKISAQESRRKKRAHVDELESRLKQIARENRELRAQLKAKNDALQKVTNRFCSMRSFISRHIRFDMSTAFSSSPSPPSTVPANPTSVQVNESAKSLKQQSFGVHPKPAFMALFLCFAVLVGCRPSALRTAGFYSNGPSTEMQHPAVNLTAERCEIALISYPCETKHRGDDFAIDEYYFDGQSFFDRNAPSIRSLRTLKRLSDQSNVFRDTDNQEDAEPSQIRSAFDSLRNALRYSTARTLFRRTVTATSEKLAAQLQQESVERPVSADATEQQSTASVSANSQNGKLLDQRAAPGRTLLFKWSMNDTTLSDWWSGVMRSFVSEQCCLSYMY